MKPSPAILLFILFSAAAVAQPGPAAASENLPALRIGPNDLIAVSVYGAPELSRSLRVGADGQIRIPMLQRPLKAEGLYASDLETAIAAALRAENILVDPVVTVTMVEYHSRPIRIIGAVRRPLTFQAVGPTNLLEAITRAEGLTPDAGPEILVSRMQPGSGGSPVSLVHRIPVKGLIDDADPQWNIALFGGEEIRVPEVGKVYVLGNIRRPGAYPLHDASGTTLLKLLALAEGLSPYAAKEAYLYRHQPADAGRIEIPVPLESIVKRKSPDIPLQANDILYIPDNKGRRLTVSTIDRLLGFGAATASGMIIWRR